MQNINKGAEVLGWNPSLQNHIFSNLLEYFNILMGS